MQIFLGDMELRPSEQPEFIQRGGGQHLAVFEFPGGNVAAQDLGPRYREVSWDGWFEGNDAYERMIRIGNMRQKGDSVVLRTEKTNQEYVIKEFHPDYKNDKYIPFTIKLQPLINLSPKNIDPLDKAMERIKANVTNPVKLVTHVVKAGELLSQIAYKYYGDANGADRIYWDNKDVLPNGPLWLKEGMKLVINLAANPLIDRSGITSRDDMYRAIYGEEPKGSTGIVKEGDSSYTIPSGKRTPTDIIIQKGNGDEVRGYTGFTYEHPQYGPTEYGYKAKDLLKELGCTANLRDNASLFDVVLNTTRTLIRVLIDGNYVENNSILLKDLEDLGIKIIYNSVASAAGFASGTRQPTKQVILEEPVKKFPIIIRNRNIDIKSVSKYFKYEFSEKDQKVYADKAEQLFIELGYIAKLSSSTSAYSVYTGGIPVSIAIFKNGSHILKDCIKISDLVQLGITSKVVDVSNIGRHMILDVTYAHKGSGRDVFVPATVTGKVNGKDVTLNPLESWYTIGGGGYNSGVQKDANGRYKIAVGPKIINPNYPDNGKIWDKYDGLEKGIEIDVVLKNKTTGEQIVIECVVDDYKAHTYNKYPDGHPSNNLTGDTANFNIENGLVQTGISYPNSWNAEKGASFAPNNIDSSVIEFAGSSIDISLKDYTLVKLVVFDK